MYLSPPALDSIKYFHLKLVSFIDKNVFLAVLFHPSLKLLPVASQTEKSL